MIIECQNCFAPLDIPSGADQVTCCYCSVTNYTARARTLQPRTPLGWRPPTHWTAPAQAPAPSHLTLPYRGPATTPAGSSKVGLSVALGGGALAILTSLLGLVFRLSNLGEVHEPGWDGTSTLVCDDYQDELRIEGMDATVEDGPVVELGRSCSLTIVDSTLRGDTVVQGGVDNRIKVINSTLVAEHTAIASEFQARIEVKKGSRIESDGTGIDLGSGGWVTLKDSNVVANGPAIDAKHNGRVRCHDSQLEGAPVIAKVGEILGPDITDDGCKMTDPTRKGGTDVKGPAGGDPNHPCEQLFARWEACKDDPAAKHDQSKIESLRRTYDRVGPSARRPLSTVCKLRLDKLDAVCAEGG